MATQTKTIRPTLATNLKQFKLKRVAVYTRVSREGKDKHHSIQMQKEHLRDDIEKHPFWRFVGFYVDEGVTGTKLDRPEFNRMMHDARAGKIDIVLMKTVSRLGRNMVAVQKVLHELQQLDVTVIFENENISSDDPDAFFHLQFLAIQAEEEARQTSDNLCWAKRNRFKEGIPTYTRPYGYVMRDRRFYIVPEEAEVIRRIFDMYLSGKGTEMICKILNEEGIPSPNGARWQSSTLGRILDNVKYTGDLLLQKYYVADFLNKRYVANRGILPQYYVEGTHEPIIDRDTFSKVQEERELRARIHGGTNTHLLQTKHSRNEPRIFSRLIRCDHCGTYLCFKRFRYDGKPRDTWGCNVHVKQGAKICPTKSIREDVLKRITKEVLLEKGLIRPETIITNDLIKLYIQKIVAKENQILEYHFHDREVVIKTWENESRSKSWTPEMRQDARKRALKSHADRKSKECESKR